MHDLSQTSAAIPAPQKPKLWFWQFRLREVLLAMVAISAVIAVVVNNMRSSQPSPIYGAVRVTHLIPQIVSHHGLTSASTSGGTGEVDGVFTSSQDYVIPGSFRAQIKSALRTMIQEKIAEYGGHEEGTASAGDTITLQYTCGRRTGVIYVAFFSISPEKWRINSVVVETSK